MSSANPQSKAGKVCFCVLLFAITLYLFASIREIDQDLNRNSDWRTYFTKDAMHYYAIGEAFASGGFSMSYEKGWPYRQSLFPLVVAGILQATNDNLFAAKLINVAAIIVAAITLFLILRAYWRDSATAAIISILFVLDPFVVGRAGSPLRRYAVFWWHYALAALVLIVTTAPSWLSRLYYFGNPFYYGAIQNFLWGDTYLGSIDSPRT